MATYSLEVAAQARREAPPFSDGCPSCVFDGAVAPCATKAEPGGTLVAHYRHRRCGSQWSCRWSLQVAEGWVAMSGRGLEELPEPEDQREGDQ